MDTEVTLRIVPLLCMVFDAIREVVQIRGVGSIPSLRAGFCSENAWPRAYHAQLHPTYNVAYIIR